MPKSKKLSLEEKVERYETALQDIRDYSPYPGSSQRAAEALDFTQPFVPSPPMRK